MPIAATSAAAALACASARCAQASWLDQISCGSCSTQPGWGKNCRNSCWALATGNPARSNRIARELVVPWSRARTKRDIGSLAAKDRDDYRRCLPQPADCRRFATPTRPGGTT
jgi:hypothetical protein